MTVERVKEVRHGEAERAAAALGATFECLDLGDYPLEIDSGRARSAIADRIREFAPDVAAHAHRPRPVQPRPRRRRSSPSSGRARSPPARESRARSRPFQPPELLLFEPHQPELCNFTPTTFVDITPVIEQKHAAMAEMKAQAYLHDVLRRSAPSSAATTRGARPGNKAIEFAEAFQRVTPQVVERAVTDAFAELAELGSGDRARGGRPLAVVDVALIQVDPRLARRGPGAHRALRRRTTT